MYRRSTRWLLAAVVGVAVIAIAAWSLQPPRAVSPTLTPTPTPPPFASGSLVLRLAEIRGIGAYQLRLSVYGDGRVVTSDPTATYIVQGQQVDFLDPNTPVFLQRRLSPRGLEILTSAVDATGSFAQSHDVPTTAKAGVSPPAIELGRDLFVQVTNGRRVQVTTASPEDPAWMVHSDERVTLNRLASRLADLSWLPSDAWVAPTLSLYDGGRWLLLTGTAQPFQTLGAAGPPDAQGIWFQAFVTDPVDIGSPFTSADGTQGIENRCAVVSSREIDALVLPLTSVGFAQAHAWFGSIVLPWSDRRVDLHLAWRLLLPDETPSCAGKAYPPAIAP